MAQSCFETTNWSLIWVQSTKVDFEEKEEKELYIAAPLNKKRQNRECEKLKAQLSQQTF